MNKSLYFSLMRETSDLAYPLILEQIEAIGSINDDLNHILHYIINKRNNQHLLLKPFLLRLSYELCGGKDWKKTIPIGAAFELLNISSYQANSAFDNKHAVLSMKEKNSQFIASMLTREACHQLLEAVKNDFETNIIYTISKDISACNKYMYIAQHYDMNLLNIDSIDRYTDEASFLVDYDKRCRYGSGIFNGLCAKAGAILAEGDNSSLDALQSFGEYFGTGLQVMNDLADFVPSGIDGVIGRSFQDQFSDLKNGRLTLGCYKLYKECGSKGDDLLNRILSNEKLQESELQNIVTMMLQTGIIDSIKKYCIAYERKAKKALSVFPDYQSKNLLFMMLTVCHVNKFTKAFATLRV